MKISKGKPARVISITSGKGGIGKTHTTVNMGLALVNSGRRVLLLDGDLGLANINILLGFKPGKTLHQVIRGEASIEDVIVTDSSGLDIIPASSGIPELTFLSEDERTMLIEEFENLASKYDYVLVDTAAGIGDNVLYFNSAAEQIIVVIGPEPTSITDAYALIKVLYQRTGRRKFSVIVNRAPLGTDGRSTFRQLAQATDKFLNVQLKLIGALTEDSSVSEAVISQRPYLQLFPSSKVALDMTKLAAKVDGDQSARGLNGGLQFFFRAILEDTTSDGVISRN
jgi:flagellar biosynthesis protein FlhG